MRQEITYTENNGYLYPDLALPEQEEAVIGRFGQKHKRFLKKASKLTYFRLLTSKKFIAYLAYIDCQAQEMFETIVNQSKEVHGIMEQLKVKTQWNGLDR